jgi:hypothetical protein
MSFGVFMPFTPKMSFWLIFSNQISFIGLKNVLGLITPTPKLVWPVCLLAR